MTIHLCRSVSVVTRKLVELHKTCMASILKVLSTVINENTRNKVFTVIKQLQMREYSKDTYRIYPKYSDTLNVRTPSFFSEKTPILCTLYFRTRSLQGIFAVRKCSDTKNMSLISHKTSIFHYLNILYICSVYRRFRLV